LVTDHLLLDRVVGHAGPVAAGQGYRIRTLKLAAWPENK